MNKTLKRLFILLLLFFLSFSLACGKEEYIDEDSYLITTYNEEVIPLYYIHTKVQDDFLNGEYKFATIYARGQEELSKPNPIVIDFSSQIRNSTSYEFSLDVSDTMENRIVFRTTEKRIELKNLKIKTVYYYQIKTETETSNIYAFCVNDDKVRNLDIDGVTNVRDLGGYKVKGKRITQGLIYRSGKFNDDESTEALVTADGINELVNVLRIKTEIDLRQVSDNENGGITSSPLGEKVKYLSIPMKSGGNCILLNKEVLPTLFKELGKEENYPIIFHCSIGTDRTGMVSFLLLNLLGVDKDDVYYDYLLSNFAPIGRGRQETQIDDYYDLISTKDGETAKEKTYNYLLSIGVDKNDIDSFIRIMTK